jgi:hypothetical protein
MGRGSGEDNGSGASRNAALGGIGGLFARAQGLLDSLSSSLGDRFAMEPNEAQTALKRAGLGALIGAALIPAPIAAAGGLGYLGFKCMDSWISSGKAKQDTSPWIRALLGRNKHGQVNTPRSAMAGAMGTAAIVALGPIALFSAPLLPALAVGSVAVLTGRAVGTWRRAGEEKGQAQSDQEEAAAPLTADQPSSPDADAHYFEQAQAASIGAVIAAAGLSPAEAAQAAQAGVIPIHPEAAAQAAQAAQEISQEVEDHSGQAPADAYTGETPVEELERELTPSEQRSLNRENRKRKFHGEAPLTAEEFLGKDDPPVRAKNSDRRQCQGKTKSGKKCSRWALPESNFCHQHQRAKSEEQDSRYVVGPEGPDGAPISSPTAPPAPSGDGLFAKRLANASVWAAEKNGASIANLRTRLGVTQDEAEELISEMERLGVVSSPDPSSGTRTALMSVAEVAKLDLLHKAPEPVSSHRAPSPEPVEAQADSPKTLLRGYPHPGPLLYERREPGSESRAAVERDFCTLPVATDEDRAKLEGLVDSGDARGASELINQRYFTPEERIQAQARFGERAIKARAPEIVDQIATNFEQAGLSERAQDLRQVSAEDINNASLHAMHGILVGDQREYWKSAPGLLNDIPSFSVRFVARSSLNGRFTERDLVTVLGDEGAQAVLSEASRYGFNRSAVIDNTLMPLCQMGGKANELLKKGVKNGNDKSACADYLLAEIRKMMKKELSKESQS